MTDDKENMPQSSNQDEIRVASSFINRTSNKVTMAQVKDPVCNCGKTREECQCGNNFSGEPVSFVYAAGLIEARFPTIGVEKEFVQAVGRGDTANYTDQQMLHKTLMEHRYLARRMCYVMNISGQDTYILQFMDPMDLERLIVAIRPVPSLGDLNVVIGVRSSIAPPEHCNGLSVPVVLVEQIYSFERNAFISSIPAPSGTSAEKFKPIAEEVFNRIMQIPDNVGNTDKDRALNYLVFRYDAIYRLAAEQLQNNSSLTSVEVRPSSMSSTRKLYDTVFTFTHRQTNVETRFYIRVDCTEIFPFLDKPLQPYYDR